VHCIGRLSEWLDQPICWPSWDYSLPTLRNKITFHLGLTDGNWVSQRMKAFKDVPVRWSYLALLRQSISGTRPVTQPPLCALKRVINSRITFPVANLCLKVTPVPCRKCGVAIKSHVLQKEISIPFDFAERLRSWWSSHHYLFLTKNKRNRASADNECKGIWSIWSYAILQSGGL